MKENDLIRLVAKIEEEYDYDEEVALSKFLKKHGDNYSQEEFINFLKKRYKIINETQDPDDYRFE